MLGGVSYVLAYAAGTQDQHGAPLEPLIGMALPQSLFLLFPIEWQLTHQAEQVAEDIFAHQRAEDAAHIGELVIAAAASIQQHIDPGIGGLKPAQLVGLGQQRLGTCRLGHQDMGFPDQFLGIALVVGSQNAQMGEVSRLEQTLVVRVVLAEQKKGTLTHTLVPYQICGVGERPLCLHLTRVDRAR